MSIVLSNILYVVSQFFLIIIYIIRSTDKYDDLNLIILDLLEIVPFYLTFNGPLIFLIYKYTKFGNFAKITITLSNVIIAVFLLLSY